MLHLSYVTPLIVILGAAVMSGKSKYVTIRIAATVYSGLNAHYLAIVNFFKSVFDKKSTIRYSN